MKIGRRSPRASRDYLVRLRRADTHRGPLPSAAAHRPVAHLVGVRGVPGNCSYVMAKHALTGLMRGLAREVAHRGIRVNTVNPAPIDNEFMRTAEKTMSVLIGRDAGEFFDEQIPLGRHGTPEEVAEAVCFLASARSSFTSGNSLMVDGGFCA
jgi:NAD(P)-dependent dehydrogenase (short-subunit alcohol dehydrogenase family)